MNAGAYKSDMGYIVSEVKVLTPDLEIKTMYNKDLEFPLSNFIFSKKSWLYLFRSNYCFKEGNKD
jgi:UDP-N-acetylenolpyruvoylglucosamine reductase